MTTDLEGYLAGYEYLTESHATRLAAEIQQMIKVASEESAEEGYQRGYEAARKEWFLAEAYARHRRSCQAGRVILNKA